MKKRGYNSYEDEHGEGFGCFLACFAFFMLVMAAAGYLVIHRIDEIQKRSNPQEHAKQ